MASDPSDLVPHQRILHGLDTENGRLIYRPSDAREMQSPAIADNAKQTYYSLPSVRCEGRPGDAECDYVVEAGHHFLIRIAIQENWPALAVKREHPNIEIAWTHNRGTNIYESITLKVGSDEGPKLDNPTTDAARGFYNTKNRHITTQLVGNVPYQENWTRALPAEPTNTSLPFSFTLVRPANGFPLLRYRDHVVHFLLVPRTSLLKLLRVRRITERDERGQVTAFEELKDLTEDILKDYLVSCPTGARLPTPALHFSFLDLLNCEKNNILSCTPAEFVWPYEDYLSYDVPNPVAYGQSAPFPITSPEVIKVIFVMAENIEATECNNHSNYSTDATSVYRGYHPIESLEIVRAGKKTIYPLIVILNWMAEHFPDCPHEHGILAFPFCLAPRLTEETVGVALGAKNGSIAVKLRDMSPFGNQDKKCLFRVRFRLQVLADITFEKDNLEKPFVFNKLKV